MTFTCREKCGDCCGIIPMPIEIARRNQDKAQVKVIKNIDIGDGCIISTTDDGFCVFLNRTTRLCSIYEDRPKVCKDFGLVPMMPCPWIWPDGHARNSKERRRVRQFQDKMCVRVTDHLIQLGSGHKPVDNHAGRL